MSAATAALEGPGDAVGLAVEAHDGVVGEELVRPAGERQVVAQVRRRVAEVHRPDVVAHRDPLVEGGEHPKPECHEEGPP